MSSIFMARYVACPHTCLWPWSMRRWAPNPDETCCESVRKVLLTIGSDGTSVTVWAEYPWRVLFDFRRDMVRWDTSLLVGVENMADHVDKVYKGSRKYILCRLMCTKLHCRVTLRLSIHWDEPSSSRWWIATEAKQLVLTWGTAESIVRCREFACDIAPNWQ